MWVNWRSTCSCILRPTFKVNALCLTSREKNQPKIQKKKIMNLCKTGSSLRAIPKSTIYICTEDSVQSGPNDSWTTLYQLTLMVAKLLFKKKRINFNGCMVELSTQLCEPDSNHSQFFKEVNFWLYWPLEVVS